VEARRLRPLALLAVATLATGCRFTWNLWARGDLARDTKSLMARQGVVVTSMKCRMFGTLRAGACIFPLSADETTRRVLADPALRHRVGPRVPVGRIPPGRAETP